jgi:hypothetical protein
MAIWGLLSSVYSHFIKKEKKNLIKILQQITQQKLPKEVTAMQNELKKSIGWICSFENSSLRMLFL